MCFVSFLTLKMGLCALLNALRRNYYRATVWSNWYGLRSTITTHSHVHIVKWPKCIFVEYSFYNRNLFCPISISLTLLPLSFWRLSHSSGKTSTVTQERNLFNLFYCFCNLGWFSSATYCCLLDETEMNRAFGKEMWHILDDFMRIFKVISQNHVYMAYVYIDIDVQRHSTAATAASLHFGARKVLNL